MAVDYKVFITSIEDILRDSGLQHDSEGNSVTERIFFDLLVYRAVCQDHVLQGQIKSHLQFMRQTVLSSQEQFASIYGNTDMFLNYYELIENIHKDPPSGAGAVCLDIWTRFTTAFAKMRSTWSPIFPTDFYLDQVQFESLHIKRAFERIIYKFQDIVVAIHPSSTDAEKSSGRRLKMDDVGDIFEFFLSCKQEKRSNSRALGQYFTPITIIDRIVSEMDIRPGSSVLDYACGSGGFLVAALRKQKNIEIYGSEISSSPYRLAVLNVFFASNFQMPDLCSSLVKCDALHFVPRLPRKVDFVLANPPFGISLNIFNKTHQLVHSSVTHQEDPCAKKKTSPPSLCWVPCADVRNAVAIKHRKPTRSMQQQQRCEFNDSEGIFLSLSISALKEQGRAGIVFSYGILTSETSTFYRDLLLSTCTIDKISLVRKGLFKNTHVETCVIFFTKAEPPPDYEIFFTDLEKNQKIFSLQKAFVCADPAKRLSQPPLSPYSCVPNSNTPNTLFEEKFASAPIRDISAIHNGTRITLQQQREKPATSLRYRAYGSGEHYYMTDTFNREHRSCKIGRFGVSPSTCVMIVEGPFFCKDSSFTITSSSPHVLDEYLWYYLLHHKQRVFDCCEGKCQKGIRMSSFGQLRVDYPRSLELQKDLIDLFENFYHSSQERAAFFHLLFLGLSIDEINEKMTFVRILFDRKTLLTSLSADLEKNKSLNVLSTLAKAESLLPVELGAVCDFENGQPLCRSDLTAGGQYPVVGGGQSPFAFHSEYNQPPHTILCSSSGSSGLISRYDTAVWASDCFAIHVKKTKACTLSADFIFHYLKAHQNDIYELRRIGRGPNHVHSADLAKFVVHLPSLEMQLQCVQQVSLLDNQKEIYRQQICDLDTMISAFLEQKDTRIIRTAVAALSNVHTNPETHRGLKRKLA